MVAIPQGGIKHSRMFSEKVINLLGLSRGVPTSFEREELVAFPLLHLRRHLHEGWNT